ncbi:MAG TPA: geranylgeranylglyceryl/heptaprenylglyceryl phosphate synthase [Bacteroidales bacterium]|nr:geranylgeranylglyceryl/heptaprenylglyceryl phosphate synthase [Bacteroidales bacterium]
MSIYNTIIEKKTSKQKMFGVLIDPDNYDINNTIKIVNICNKARVNFILIGGSLLKYNNIDNCIETIKANSNIPVLLFPGGTMQISYKANGILLLSLISGRNPDMLIGKHVESSFILKNSNLEIIPTGYILIDGGKITSVQYISNTIPIPADKANLVVATALAGEMLGLKIIYLEAGSGALNPVPPSVIQKIHKYVNLPIIVGGGIKKPETAKAACDAGADIIIVGNSIEQNPNLIFDISNTICEYK